MSPIANPGNLLVAAILLIIGTLTFALGPLMHESDQASLLRGGIRLAEGRTSPWAGDFYNYDKQFASYWTLAIADRIFPNADRVLLGNVVSFGIFWSGLLVLTGFSRIRSGLPAAGVLACAVSPAIWVHSPFLASAFLASGFLFWAWTCWRFSKGRRWLRAPAILLLAWSVGCRADVVLLVPLLGWLAIPPGGMRRLVGRAWPYVLAGAAIGAVLLGRLVTIGGVVDVHAPFFYPKVFAAYFAFGLGIAAVVVFGNLVGLVWTSWMRRSRPTWMFYVLGAVGMLLPTAYYSLQMFSPRYWVVTICGQILLLSSRRGGRIFQLGSPAVRRGLAWGLVAACLAPIFLGVRMQSLASARLVLWEPTCFPSADGHLPMGALGWYIWAQRALPEGFDHNHATWLAAQSVEYAEDETGAVPLPLSALRTYPELAVELQGKQSWIAPLDGRYFYIDLRQILRSRNVFTGMEAIDRGEFFRRYRVEPVSRNVNGYLIVKGEAGGFSTNEILRNFALADMFEGAEFEPPAAFSEERLRAAEAFGKSVVLFSTTPFSVGILNGSPVERPAEKTPKLGYALRLSADEAGRATLVAGADAVSISISRLPEYMDLQNL